MFEYENIQEIVVFGEIYRGSLDLGATGSHLEIMFENFKFLSEIFR